HFGITMDEQIELPMEDEKTASRLPQEAEQKGEPPLNASLRPSLTPEKRIKKAYSELNDKLADDLLKRIMDNSPWFFERLVVKLLLSMGYGGADSEAGIVTPRSRDGGIDGVVKQDKLGFDQIYIQAKRWKPGLTVQKPEIQKFYGALSGMNADKGLFITTAKFSQGAIDYANQQRIVLVDGKRLTHLMIEYNVGVSTVSKYEIKAVDTDFFNDGEIS
ncbi:MAG: restriction endonuclease, partial [Oscillibacter sp.]|nr:restriction endonuclease [Oscillibacter sp.]